MNYPDRISDISALQADYFGGKPFSGAVLFKIKELYRISFVYSYDAIEGSILTEYETKSAVNGIPKTDMQHEQDMLLASGHSASYSLMFQLIKNDITEADILKLHKTLFSLMPDFKGGKYRENNLIASETAYIPPDFNKIPNLINDFINIMPEMEKILPPSVYAAWLNLNFLNIHPFDGGNYICAALLSSAALLKAGYPPLIIPPVLKKDYFEALKQAQIEKEPSLLTAFISDVLFETMRDLVCRKGIL